MFFLLVVHLYFVFPVDIKAIVVRFLDLVVFLRFLEMTGSTLRMNDVDGID